MKDGAERPMTGMAGRRQENCPEFEKNFIFVFWRFHISRRCEGGAMMEDKQSVKSTSSVKEDPKRESVCLLDDM